jgi:flagellar protein FlgJ
MSADGINRYGNALDPQGLTRLKADLQRPSQETAREVAKQFEALFVQTMLKSMRASMAGDALIGGEQEAQYRDLLDNQLSLNMAQGRGLGLAPVIERQLLANMGLSQPEAAPVRADLPRYRAAAVRSIAPEPTPAASAPAAAVNPPAVGAKGQTFDSPQAFVKSVWGAAEGAAKRLGVATEALVAQAALETGWGKHVIRRGDGGSSNNLFGIKSHGWAGDSVKVKTLEFRDGVAQKELASFRAYGSLEDAFEDYARFIESNPRYRKALEAAGDAEAYLRELQAAGYATDPAYAEKITRIMHSRTLSSAAGDGEGSA